MNFKETEIIFKTADSIGGKLGKVLLSNYANLNVEGPSITLGPFGAFDLLSWLDSGYLVQAAIKKRK